MLGGGGVVWVVGGDGGGGGKEWVEKVCRNICGRHKLSS